MATLEKRGDSYRVIFYYQNVRFARSLKTDNRKKADEQKRRLEGNLDLLEQGRLLGRMTFPRSFSPMAN